MKLFIAVLLLVAVATPALSQQFDYICIANRGAQSVSIINTVDDSIVRLVTVSPPEGGNPTVPMYCNHYKNELGEWLTVGDRANDVVIVYDVANNFEEHRRINVGAGVFHHWVGEVANQIWIICDAAGTGIDNINIYVASATTWDILAVIPLPDDLKVVATGSKGTLHDIAVDPLGEFAIATTWNMPGFSDYALKFSTSTFQLTGQLATGSQSHTTYQNTGDRHLYVASQASLLDSIMVIDVDTMTKITSTAGIAGAHMLWGPSADGKTYYATNLPGGGLDGLYAFDAVSQTVDFSSTADVPYSVPHNVAFNGARDKLYLTHSGPHTETTIWAVGDAFNPRPLLLGQVQTGSNPYGIFNFQSDVNIGSGSSAGNAASSLMPSSFFMFSALALLLVKMLF